MSIVSKPGQSSNIFFMFNFRSDHEIDSYRHSKEITLKGDDIPKPVFRFDEVNFPDFVIKEIT